MRYKRFNLIKIILTILLGVILVVLIMFSGIFDKKIGRTKDIVGTQSSTASQISEDESVTDIVPKD